MLYTYNVCSTKYYNLFLSTSPIAVTSTDVIINVIASSLDKINTQISLDISHYMWWLQGLVHNSLFSHSFGSIVLLAISQIRPPYLFASRLGKREVINDFAMQIFGNGPETDNFRMQPFVNVCTGRIRCNRKLRVTVLGEPFHRSRTNWNATASHRPGFESSA